MNTNSKIILEYLETCLQILHVIPAGEVGNYQNEIDKAQTALSAARDLAKQEMADVILGGLYAMGYEAGHILLRVTAQDFSCVLADYMARRGIVPADLTPDELENLFTAACDALNGEGVPWAEVIKIALADA